MIPASEGRAAQSEPPQEWQQAGAAALAVAGSDFRSLALVRSPPARSQTPLSHVPVPARTGLSACVITYNEADRIAACLASLAFCDEVVVVDSHSTDGSREIAAAAGARVIERDWSGYRAQKQFAVQAARHDWVLCLDADEVVSPQLATEIILLRRRGFDDAACYSMPRCTEYFGRMIRHGNWYPDRAKRLFDRRRARWGGREIHEKVIADGPVRQLDGEIEHYAYRNLNDQLSRLGRYAELMARALHAEGRRARWWNLLLSPAWRAFRSVVLRGGWRDGWRGLAIAWIESNYVRQKFLALWLLERGLPVGENDRP